jgi:hypothetical protein
MKVKEIGKLKGNIYSENKVKVKKVFKKYKMAFNQGACLSSNLFLWQGEDVAVEGKFVKDEAGVTQSATFIITGKERTPAFDELKECVEALGGSWSVAAEEEVKAEEEEEADAELVAFDKEWKNKLLSEERKARSAKFKHCPILRPMVKQFIEEREKRFNIKSETVEQIMEQIYKQVNKERGETDDE